MMQLQARMALRQSRLSLYPGDTIKASMLDISRDPLREMALETAMTQRKLRVSQFLDYCIYNSASQGIFFFLSFYLNSS